MSIDLLLSIVVVVAVVVESGDLFALHPMLSNSLVVVKLVDNCWIEPTCCWLTCLVCCLLNIVILIIFNCCIVTRCNLTWPNPTLVVGVLVVCCCADVQFQCQCQWVGGGGGWWCVTAQMTDDLTWLVPVLLLTDWLDLGCWPLLTRLAGDGADDWMGSRWCRSMTQVIGGLIDLICWLVVLYGR